MAQDGTAPASTPDVHSLSGTDPPSLSARLPMALVHVSPPSDFERGFGFTLDAVESLASLIDVHTGMALKPKKPSYDDDDDEIVRFRKNDL